jgi:hypothetical protein
MRSDRPVPPRSVLLAAFLGVALIGSALLLFGGQQLASAATPTLTIGSVSAHPGTQANFNVTLATAGAPIVAIQNDIVFDPVHAPIALTNTGQPDCTVNPSLGTQGNFAFLPAGCSGADCSILRAAISSLTTQGRNLPSGVMYTCTIGAGSTTGTYPLTAFRVLGSSSAGASIQASAVNGALTVTPVGC